jgi:tetratricopeptide (TPR) repeat protein
MEIYVLWLLGAAIGGVMGNRVDYLFCQSIRPLCDRLRQGGPAVQDLQRAVRKACLQAAIVVCDAYLKELGKAPKAPLNSFFSSFTSMSIRSGEDQTVRWLTKVRDALSTELRQLPQAIYVPSSPEVEAQIELLLQPTSEPSDQRVNKLSEMMKDEMLKELESIGFSSPNTPIGLLGEMKPPPRFIEMMKYGWEDHTSGRPSTYMDWFEVVCALFAHEMKVNEKLRSQMENELLLHLTIEDKKLPLELIQAQFEEFGFEMVRRLTHLEDHFSKLRNDQARNFDNVHNRFDEMLPLLTLLPDIWRGQEAVQRISRILLRESARSNYELYASVETANRVDQIIRASVEFFVGREREIQQLDDFIQHNVNGTLLVIAKAGFGKTALLSNWIAQGQYKGRFIVYHFFSNKYKEATYTIAHGLRNILRQLYIFYGIADMRLPEDESTLRDVINGLLRDRGADFGEPLIIVIDGLDETERPFFPPFPSPLPDNVFIVVAARAVEDEEPEYLQGWMEDASPLYFERLNREAIAEWLRQAGSGKLERLTEDVDFITQVEEKTEGFPLYMRYLIDELVQENRDTRIVLEQTPRGFEKYVEQQFHQLAHVEEIRRESKIQRLFALLAVALGELSKKEVQELTKLSVWDLEDLPWQVTRWIMIREQAGTTTYAFAHPLLAEEFKLALEHEAEACRTLLLDYCAGWRENNSIYALQYYPQHLKESKRYDELFALAHNEVFRQDQIAALPNDPELPLRTIQTALQGALNADDVKRIAELSFMHVSFASTIGSNETPLEALRRGNLNKALKLTNNFDDPVPSLWKFLLIWHMARNGEAEEAKLFLQEFTVSGNRLSGWYADVVNMILSALDGFEDALILNVAKKLLTYYKLKELVLCFVKRKTDQSLSLAINVLPLIRDQGEREKAVGTVVVELARVGRWEEALRYVEQISDPWSRAWALSDLTSVALEQKDLAKAQMIAWEIEVLQDKLTLSNSFLELNWQLSKSLAHIAVYHFHENKAMTYSIISTIKNLADKTTRETFRSRVLAEVARACVLTGQKEEAEKILEEAIRITARFSRPREAARSFAYISRVYSQAGIRTVALEILARAVRTSDHIDDEIARAEVLREIALDYAYEGDSEMAVNLAFQVSNRGTTAEIKTEVAKILIEQGLRDKAYDLAYDVPHWIAARLLSGIAVSLLNQGLVTEAEEALSQSFMKMRIFYSNQPSLPIIQALANISQVYFKVGQYDKAQTLIGFTKDKAAAHQDHIKRCWHMIDIAEAIEDTGYVEIIIDLLETAYSAGKQVEKLISKVWILSQIAKHMYRYGSRPRAEELFHEVATLTEMIQDAAERTKALCLWGTAVHATGEVDRALEILERAETTAFNITLFHLQRSTLAYVAFAYAKLNFINKAKGLLAVRGVSRRPDSQESLAIILTSEGRLDEAVKIARGIRDIRRQAKALRHIAQREIKQGQTKKVAHIIRLIISNRNIESDPVELPLIMKAIVKAGDLDLFKKFFVNTAYRTGSAYMMLGLLAQLYPQNVSEIEEVLLNNLRPALGTQQT